MRTLLDTHTFLWWMIEDSRLSINVREIIEDAQNEVYFSAASAWKIAIKQQLGRITFGKDLGTLIPEALAANGFASLPIRTEHALQVAKLPPLHRDPFDRMLVAQAIVENLVLLTADTTIAGYGLDVLW